MRSLLNWISVIDLHTLLFTMWRFVFFSDYRQSMTIGPRISPHHCQPNHVKCLCNDRTVIAQRDVQKTIRYFCPQTFVISALPNCLIGVRKSDDLLTKTGFYILRPDISLHFFEPSRLPLQRYQFRFDSQMLMHISRHLQALRSHFALEVHP